MNDDHLTPKMGTDRSFGLVLAGFFAALAAYRAFVGLRFWWICFAIAVIFAAVALAAPKLLRPLNRLWFKLGLVLNHIVSPVVLGAAFFGVIVPIAYLARLRGKDSLRLRRSEAQSYWHHRDPPGPSGKSMEQQY